LKRFFNCEDRVDEHLFVRGEGHGGCRGCGSREHPVVGPEDPPVIARDRQVPTNGEVDERRRDVDEIDLLIENGADHAGLHTRRRVELHRDGGRLAADDDGDVLAGSGGQTRGESGVLLVAPSGPHEHAHEGAGEERPEHAQAHGQPAQSTRLPRADR
jgi:hypothetical protein